LAKNAIKATAANKMESAVSDMKQKAQEKLEDAKEQAKDKALQKATSMIGGSSTKGFSLCEDVQIFAQVLLPLAIKMTRISNFEKNGKINIESEFLALTVIGIFSSCRIFACYCIDTVFTLLTLYFAQGIIKEEGKIRTLGLIPWYFLYMVTMDR
jgi:hypothetical protein